MQFSSIDLRVNVKRIAYSGAVRLIMLLLIFAHSEIVMAKAKPKPHSITAAITLPAVTSTSISLNVFAQQLLDLNNAERIRVGSPPLQWDEGLASDARQWAQYLAKNGLFEHGSAAKDKPPFGENLWSGTASSYSAQEMVGMWIDEKKLYKNGIFPAISKTGNWVDVGHYTQLIWPKTTKLGCALATGGGDDYLVCRYYPAGNWIGTKLNIKE